MTEPRPWTLRFRVRNAQRVVLEMRLRADPTVFILITAQEIPGREPPITVVTVEGKEEHWRQLKPHWEEFMTEMAAQGIPMRFSPADPKSKRKS